MQNSVGDNLTPLTVGGPMAMGGRGSVRTPASPATTGAQRGALSASVRPGLAADIPVFDVNRRQFVIAQSVYTSTASPPVCTPTDRHGRLRKADDRASDSNRHLPSERHPADLPAFTSLDEQIRLVEDRIRELEASISVPDSPRMSSSRLFNTGTSAVRQQRQLPKVPPTRRRRTLPPTLAESVPRSSSRSPPDDVADRHEPLSPVIDSPIGEERHHSKRATTLRPVVAVSTFPEARLHVEDRIGVPDSPRMSRVASGSALTRPTSSSAHACSK